MVIVSDGKFKAAVGEVAQQAAQLESVVAIVAWGLAGLEDDIARIVVPNNMDRMLSLITDLLPIRVLDDGLRQDVSKWASSVRGVYRQRNSILHSVWIPVDDDETHMRFDLKPLDRDKGKRTSGEVLSLANDMEYLATEGAAVFMRRLAHSTPGPWLVY